MPAIRLFGRRWHFSSDILPVPAVLAALFHGPWIIIMIAAPAALGDWPHHCSSWEGVQYIVLFAAFLAAYIAAFIVDVLLFYYGMQGAPLEESKRRMVPTLLYIGTIPLILQFSATLYGTWVCVELQPDCWEEEDRNAITNFAQALVFFNWAFCFLALLGAAIFFNMYPDLHTRESWERRCVCIAQVLCCRDNIQRSPDGKSPPLKNIAELSAGLLTHVDLVASDIAAGFILTSASQSRRRRLRIAKALLPAYRAMRSANRQQRIDGGESAFGQLPSEFQFSESAFENETEPDSDALDDVDPATQLDLPTDEELTRKLSVVVDGPAQIYGGPSTRVHVNASANDAAHHEQAEGANIVSGPRLTEANVATFNTLDQVRKSVAGSEDEHAAVAAEVIANLAAGAAQAAEIRSAGGEASGVVDDGEATTQAEAIDELAEAIEREVELLGEGPLEEAVLSVKHQESLDLATLPLSSEQPAIWFRTSPSTPGAGSHSGSQTGKDTQGEEEEKLSEPVSPEEKQEAAKAVLSSAIERAVAEEQGQRMPKAPSGSLVEDAERHITLQQPALLTPTEHVEELAGPLPPEALAAVYRGRHEAVPASHLRTVRNFLRIASAAYALQPHIERLPSGFLDRLCFWRYRKDAQEIVLRAIHELKGPEGEPDASIELLHFNCSNRVLAHLPYMVVLDHAERAVVVAIRGTISLADLVTDAVVYPEVVDDWLPEDIRGELEGPALAHAGMVAAARAIFRDMQERGTLGELVESEEGMEELTRAPGQEHMNREKGRGGGMAGGGGADGGGRGGGGGGTGGGVTVGRGQREADQDAEEWHTHQRSSNPTTASPDAAQYRVGGQVSDDVAQQERGAQAGVLSPGQQVGHLMKKKIDEEGWRLVVVGHSLGGGVAALISLKLRKHYPQVECLAYSCPGGLVSKNLAHAMAPFCTTIAVGKDAVPRATVANMVRLMDEMMTALARCRKPKLAVLLSPWIRGTKLPFKNLFFQYKEIPPEAAEILVNYYESRRQVGQPVPMYPPGRVVFLRPLNMRGKRLWDGIWVAPEDLIGEGVLVAPSMLSDHLCSTAWEAAMAATINAEAAETTRREDTMGVGRAQGAWTDRMMLPAPLVALRTAAEWFRPQPQQTYRQGSLQKELIEAD